MSMETMPALLSSLNDNHCISTRWIAEAADKEIFRVHEDARRLFKVNLDKFDVERNRQGKVTVIWLPLGEALYLMSRYEGERADRAREFIIEAVDWYVHTRPRLEAELSHAREIVTAVTEHNTTLRNENQELAGRFRAYIPRAKRTKRYEVPVFYSAMFGPGLQIQSELRSQAECQPWQWGMGMAPMMAHLVESVVAKVSEVKNEAVKALMAKFTPEELPMKREEFEEAMRRIVDEYVHKEPPKH